MPRVGLELTIPVFERAKTLNALDALDREATVIDRLTITSGMTYIHSVSGIKNTHYLQPTERAFS
jgi:hypothetical protein